MGQLRGGKGRFIDLETRIQVLELIKEAVANGCRKELACKDLGIDIKTAQRWQKAEDLVDKRTTRQYEPGNKLTQQEREEILRIANNPEFRDLPPSQIVPILLDRGEYYASESTIYRILRAEKMMVHRGRHRSPSRQRPGAHTATAPNQIWTWDITYLPCDIRGKFYYLYMIIDIFSRKIVGWSIHEEESASHAADLIEQAYRSERIKPGLILHSDNGSPMRGGTMLAKLQGLGVVPSFSRPRVSNDNPFSESLFRTLKYRPGFPDDCFKSMVDARQWVGLFVSWYNGQHRHSGLKFITPNQRHTKKCNQIMRQRKQVLERAKQKHTSRWSRDTRNWDLPQEVSLNRPRFKEVGCESAA